MAKRTYQTPEKLTEIVRGKLQFDIEDFRPYVITRFGQKIQTVNKDGYWHERLRVVHLGYADRLIRWWNLPLNNNPIIEWSFRSWSLERIETCSDLRPMEELADEIHNLEVNTKLTQSMQEESAFDWFSSMCLRACTERKVNLLTGLRLFYAWCVEEEIPFVSEYRLGSIYEISFNGRSETSLSSLLDPVTGPYSQSELIRIETSLSERPDLITEAAIFYLGRDWGLRPIQLALLRPIDLGEDDLGTYIMVPSVKGRSKSILRRADSNFIKRYITPEAASAVRDLIQSSEIKAQELRKKIRSLNEFSMIGDEQLPTPLFPVEELNLERIANMLRSPSLRSYTLHCLSTKISKRARGLTLKLALAGDDKETSSLIQIGCYRLRRTKGTSLALSGASPDEVAEALDHSDTTTIAHYFRFTRDLIDFINVTHSKSKELKSAVDAWSTKIVTLPEASAKKMTVISNLGICNRGSVCPHHPTVSCYACAEFRPYRDADHRKSRDSIDALRSKIGKDSSGPIKRQLDQAYNGATSLVSFLNELKSHAK